MSPSHPGTPQKYHGNFCDASTLAPEDENFAVPSTTTFDDFGHPSPDAILAAGPRADPARYADAARLDYAERLVLFDLLLRDAPVAGVRTWARVIGLNERTVKRALDTLERLGLVEVRSSAPGLPTAIRMRHPYAEVPTPRLMTNVGVLTPYAEIRHPSDAPVRHPGADVPPGAAHPRHPGADVHPLLEEKQRSSSFSLEELARQLPPAYAADLYADSNAGGRTTLTRLLEELARRDPAAPARLFAQIPATGLRSVTAYLITQARALLDSPTRRLSVVRPPGSPPGPHDRGPSATPAAPSADPAEAYAITQARAVRSDADAEIVRRGIELEFAEDPDRVRRALDAFDRVLAS